MLAILLIPAALTYTFGRMIGDTRQGWALLAAMTLIFVPFLVVAADFEQAGNPLFTPQGVDQRHTRSRRAGIWRGRRSGLVSSTRRCSRR